MEKIVVRGGKRLRGKINLQGSKNAALPIIFATVITDGTSYLKNVPEIGDVEVALGILKSMGARVMREGDTVVINTENMAYKTPSPDAVSRIRASTYLLGACLARFGVSEIMNFGGCNFGNRPIDLHIDAALALGAQLKADRLTAKKLVGARIELKKPSVGATINALIMASVAEGITELYGYAREPHVLALIDFLKSCGARISDCGEYLKICGTRLGGGSLTVIPDMIEAGTYLLLSSVDEGRVAVSSEVTPSLTSFICALAESGVRVFVKDNELYLDGVPNDEIRVKTAPYPGYPTDLQPQLSPLMAAFFGGEIEETVWQDRFGYLTELSRFGIKYRTKDCTVRIYPSAIKPARVSAPDLRGGAACLYAALLANGESEIYSPEKLLRGYSHLCENLTSLGADIKIV